MNLKWLGMHWATSGMSNQLAWLETNRAACPLGGTFSCPETTDGAQPPTAMLTLDHVLPTQSWNSRSSSHPVASHTVSVKLSASHHKEPRKSTLCTPYSAPKGLTDLPLMVRYGPSSSGSGGLTPRAASSAAASSSGAPARRAAERRKTTGRAWNAPAHAASAATSAVRSMKIARCPRSSDEVSPAQIGQGLQRPCSPNRNQKRRRGTGMRERKRLCWRGRLISRSAIQHAGETPGLLSSPQPPHASTRIQLLLV